MRHVVLCLPDGAPRVDPGPDETARRDVELAFTWDGSPAGLVGHAEGGSEALALAAEHADLVDRLVLVSTPVPDPGDTPPAVTAKILLLFGSRDGGHARATWWQDRVGGRIEMVPGEGDDILERVWPRVLSHLAPGSLRTAPPR
jgi:pimeloyl-ACP methyl ester carboxylesterase